MRAAARVTGVISLAGLAVAAALGTSSARPARRPPQFFVDTVATGQFAGPLEIRASKTGKLLDETAWLPGRAALAAIDGRTFVVALPQPSGCATRLYRLRVDQRGRAGSRSVFGPILPGTVWSVAASGDSKSVGLYSSGCVKGDPGFLEVLDVHTGRVRRWGGLTLGNIAISGSVSMSANGHVLLFADSAIAHPPYGGITAQEVRSLDTNAPPGTVAARSKLLLRQPGITSTFTAASITPNASNFYLCEQTQTTAKILAYRTGASAPSATIAVFTSKRRSKNSKSSRVDCSAMALDRSGRVLLVPYLLSFPPQHGQAAQHVATIDTATRTRTTFTLRIPSPNGGWPSAGVYPAW